MPWNPTYFQKCAENKHKLAMMVAGTNVLKLSLSNTIPDAANDGLWADLSLDELAAGNGYTAGGYTLSYTASQTAGTFALTITADVTISASGGNIGPFQYAIARDTTATGEPLVLFFTRSEGADTVTDGNGKTLSLNTVVIYQDNPPA